MIFWTPDNDVLGSSLRYEGLTGHGINFNNFVAGIYNNRVYNGYMY